MKITLFKTCRFGSGIYDFKKNILNYLTDMYVVQGRRYYFGGYYDIDKSIIINKIYSIEIKDIVVYSSVKYESYDVHVCMECLYHVKTK